ncbi:hypothetical protein [Frigoribacterium endophyticum]|uniref:hypothetical protein n=1 Tax=Frigoribacterium endophyticum TaxID=1522176 RepID=UPI001424402B|nr:hypothetical protein [Frigoribacterium endophyticum]NII52119.1 hypothetical protein [Frigoribacterium endophyticum]
MTVNDTAYLLAQDQDTARIEAESVSAAQGGGAILHVTVVGNRTLDVLVTPGVAVTFETVDVDDDDRDDGDTNAPYDVPDFDDSYFHPETSP